MIMTDYKAPWFFSDDLKKERLTIVAEELLKVLDNTYMQLSTPLDDNYTRGTCTFGRQRQLLIQLCMSGKFDWLKLSHAGMDVTFSIGTVPVRFFADDPDNPQKSGFYRRNQVDQLWEPELTAPTMHRFVIEKPEFEGEGARVHFIGYNALNEMVSKWTYGDERVTVLHSEDNTPPLSVPIDLDPISVLTTDVGKSSNSKNEK